MKWILFSKKQPKKLQKIIFTEVCRVAKREPYVGMGIYVGLDDWNYSLTKWVEEREKKHLWGRDKYSVEGRKWHMEESEMVAWIPMPDPFEDEHADDWVYEYE